MTTTNNHFTLKNFIILILGSIALIMGFYIIEHSPSLLIKLTGIFISSLGGTPIPFAITHIVLGGTLSGKI